MDSFNPLSRLTHSLFRSSRSSPGVLGVFAALLNAFLGVLAFFVQIIAVLFAILAGNFIGDKLRAQVSGQPGHQLEFIHQDEHGNTFLAANLLLSNFLPGLLLAILLRPRIVFGFLGGMVASFFLGDRYEDQMWETMDEFLAGGDPTRNWPTPGGQVELDVPTAKSKR